MYHINADGTKSFLIDAVDKNDAIVALAKFNISVLKTEEAIFSDSGKVLDIDFTVDAKDEEISFALDSMTKMLRPYPKGFVHKG